MKIESHAARQPIAQHLKRLLWSGFLLSSTLALSDTFANQSVFANNGDWYRAGSVTNDTDTAQQQLIIHFSYDGPALSKDKDMWGVSQLQRNGNQYTAIIDAPDWKTNGFTPGDTVNFGINLDGANAPLSRQYFGNGPRPN